MQHSCPIPGLSLSSNNNIANHIMEIGQDALPGPDVDTGHEVVAASPLSDAPLVFELSQIEDIESLSKTSQTIKGLQWSLEYFTILAHLAFFGIIGVLVRYGLGTLFDDVLSVTVEGTILYKDLPSNVVGSFFMGWVGIVWKEDILELCEPLAIGLSTGLMGSITTYAAWNQAMADLLTSGHLAAALLGLLLGMAIAQMSLLAGFDSARGLKQACARGRQNHTAQGSPNNSKESRTNSLRCTVSSMVVIVLAVACMWGAALVLLIHGRSSRTLQSLWLGCVVAPPGVWTRWHLARLNGKGVVGRLKWLPLGTLAANLLGAGLEALLALLQFVVGEHHRAPMILKGLQLGFLGCLSTVSTFVAEVYAIHCSSIRARAYVYTLLTLALGFILSLLLYSAPAWARGYVKW